MDQIFGTKVEYLVYKFIAKLKMRVKKRKDESIKKSTDKFIMKILKKKDFHDQFKRVQPQTNVAKKRFENDGTHFDTFDPEFSSEQPSSDEDDEHYKNEKVKSEVLADYIQESLEKGDKPLPVLNMVTSDGVLPLINY